MASFAVVGGDDGGDVGKDFGRISPLEASPSTLKELVMGVYYTLKLMYGNKAKLKCPSLALLRCKMNFEIFELGLIAVQIKHLNF